MKNFSRSLFIKLIPWNELSLMIVSIKSVLKLLIGTGHAFNVLTKLNIDSSSGFLYK